jgi:hypothetical protein
MEVVAALAVARLIGSDRDDDHRQAVCQGTDHAARPAMGHDQVAMRQVLCLGM